MATPFGVTCAHLSQARSIYLHQRPALFDGSVEDNLRLPLALGAIAIEDSTGRTALDLLAAWGATRPFSISPNRSTFRRRGTDRGAWSAALQLEPAVLLLDEPTAALDADTTAAFEQVVENWLSAGPDSRAYVWVSHNREQTRRVATTVRQYRGGRRSRGP